MQAAVDTEPQTAPSAWHTVDADEVFSALGTDPVGGLDAGEAARRLKQHGPNRLPEGKKQSAVMRLVLQFHNVLVYVLLAAAS